MIALRPHHLLCILNYIGKGYTENFVQNYDGIVHRINGGETEIKIVDGPDDICAPRLCDVNDTDCHCHNNSIIQRDLAALKDLNLSYNQTIFLDNDRVSAMRRDFANGQGRTACLGCEWFELCTDISNNNYKGTKLK